MSKKFFKLTFLFLLVSAHVFGQANEFYNDVNYKGAFGMTNWMKGWTAMDHYGYLAPNTEPSTVVNVSDDDIVAGDMVYWTADNIYLLDGFVFVEDGAVLNIEAGTVIKATAGQGEDATALIISQGAKIYAEGTAERPIIFTTESDDVTDPTDLVLPASNLWGGLIILGKAQINTTTGVGNIEGIPAEARTQYGGNDDDDNSGVLRYVSIRHGGTNIGSGDEINGLTLGGVGRGTTIEYVEVFNNNDDGFEWFGGTVNSKYLVSAFNADDAFDHDEGIRGKMQFLFAIMDPDFGNHGGEHDGGTDPEDGEPYAYPQVYNATYLGSGMNSTNADNEQMFIMRDFWGGEYKNSIFGDFAGAGLNIEDLASGNDSRLRLDNGQILLHNNIWFDFGAGSSWDAIGVHDYESDYLSNAANGNSLSNPNLAAISRDAYTEGLDPRPEADGAAYEDLAEIPNDDFFDHVNYKGAFGSTNWMKGWTALDHYGYLAPDKIPTNTVNVTDADINSGEQIYWTADNTYLIDGFVYVEDGAVLNIEAGTVIKAAAGQGEDASALIVSQGAKIYAEGTGVNPIIFTAESDDVTNPTDLVLPTSNLWGGLILLGKAQINTTAGVGNIEGIPAVASTQYGGNDDWDNSGVLRYVSIRHGGTNIGSGDEINGLTLGGVGNGTTIEYVEVFNNNDDGFEWFGGMVDCRFLVSAFNADDAFDHDEGIRGKQQFLFAIMDPDFGNHGGEHDGGTDPEDGTPYAFPQVYNATYLGSGMTSSNADNEQMFLMRDFWGGSYKNSIFGDFAGAGLNIEDLASGNDSKLRLDEGQIILHNNIWFDFGAGSTFDALGVHDYESAYLADGANGNVIESPGLLSISREAYTEELDPRPAPEGAAWENLTEVTSIRETRNSDVIPTDYKLSQNYPNPFNPSTKINFAIPAAGQVSLKIYNILGQEIATLLNAFRNAGTYTINWDASNLSSGIYIYRLESGSNVITKKMTLLK
ncbi:MAG: T9SS type A sorting domain-containing protein [Melioribacteraceae bacterium]|nr:T9SS type A sorting domain-containing protein [Melioribacteraceae bacterium]MCF8355083.1 T9SS type A sorting domain-containing protein [Melioribacteraceae bacterium]MCF8394648.1 T9SS type A sorting domain-containing protein [Melioribacteraceae bacterium]MCF8420301.1 T9SS type A sorting domain-containing protein [Melioribacteraceae bacterium]